MPYLFSSDSLTILQVLNDVINTAALSTAQITADFRMNDIDENPDKNAWITIVLGIVGAAGAMVPGLGPVFQAAQVAKQTAEVAMKAASVATGAAANSMVVFNGVTALTAASERELYFKDFAELQHNLGQFKELAQHSMESYFKEILSERPPIDGRKAGSELDLILQHGYWAEQDHLLQSQGTTNLKKIVQSAIITELWNSQKMVLLKFSPTLFTWWGYNFPKHFSMPTYETALFDLSKFRVMYGWSPCAGLPIPSKYRRLTLASACIGDGWNYAFVSLPVRAPQRSQVSIV